jgi:predicted nucleic acid-binding Zn ribbon protein
MKKKGGVAPIQDLIDRWLKTSKAPERLRDRSLHHRWREVVGEEIAARTRPIQVRSGELMVEVNSPALLTELSTFYRQEILAALRQQEGCRGIHAIRFRAGSF